jgi:hypothetical protein
MPLKMSSVDPKILYVPPSFHIEPQIALSIKFDFVSCIDARLASFKYPIHKSNDQIFFIKIN